MSKIDPDEVARNYNNQDPIWQKEDKWHIYNFKKIQQYLEAIKDDCHGKLILNAGSAGESYGFPEDKMIHFDLIDLKIKNKKLYLTGNIESLPFQNNYFDLIICVGEVINYCDAAKSINEFSRIMKIFGEVVIEFESSRSLELIFTKQFNASSIIRKTFYQGRQEKIWYYSEIYILNLLRAAGLEPNRTERFHMLSILVYRITKSPNFAAKFTWLDKIIHYIPFLNQCASNVIITAKKIK